MSGVRVLVGTRKGAFVLTADGTREHWDVSGPHFAGWEIYHVQGLAGRPDRLYASQSSGWFGQLIQRSRRRRRDLGAGRQRVRATTACPAPTSGTTARRTRGSSPGSGTSSRRCTDPDTVYAGVEDAALFRSAGRRQELAGAARAARPRLRPALAARRRRDVPAHDPARPGDPKRIFVAISAAGAFRTDDGGATWRPINRGPALRGHPGPGRRGRPLRAPHRHAPARARTCCSCRSTGTSCAATTPASTGARSAATCRRDFGFPIDVHAHEPETVYVVPITSDS